MSSSVFSETASARPNGVDGDSNLVVVYSKSGISFDERAIENIMEEKSISSISVVRLTSPTPSMIEQEETERLEELERFLETATDREDSEAERDTDAESQSGGDEILSEKDHVTGDDNENTGGENNDDSTETEAEAPKVKKRPGRKPKAPKKQKKRRKPKERPQIVGLSVEQFYVESSADLVVKNALKLAGLSIFKRTPKSDALLEIIRNDHNYTPFTSPEQMKAKKTAEKLVMERQTVQGRKFIVQTQPGIKVLSAKKRFQVVPFSQQQLQQLPRQQQQQQQLHKQLQQKQATASNNSKQQQFTRSGLKVISAPDDHVEDDEDANSSATADEENADTEELSEPSDESRETDNDRDSDIDFKMNNSRNSNKRKRIKKLSKRPQPQTPRHGPVMHIPKVSQPPAAAPQFPNLKRRKELPDNSLVSPAIGQIVQLNTKAPASVIALGRSIPSTSFLKMRPTHKSLVTTSASPLSPEAPRLSSAAVASKVRRTPIVQVGHPVNATTGGPFVTPPQDIKEIIINKNISSPKGVFTNLNSLLADNNNTTLHSASSPDLGKKRLLATPITPKSSLNTLTPSTAAPSKGFMPIGVETATSHKLPAQIVIETHQSSSELAAENDKQLDLIDSIVQDELLKASLVDQPPASADETIPKLVKMLESSAAGLDQVAESNVKVLNIQPQTHNFNVNVNVTSNDAVANIDIANARLLETPDEDEITADFLQHVVGLIEEDKQFEAEVVKQVLASTETGGLDAITNAVVPPIFDNVPQLSTITQPQLNDFPAINVTNSLTNLPMACSTPSRSIITLSTSLSSRPEVKVVRGNGRVIYLPPIEAPTTRAKRRAQIPNTSMNTSDISNISICEPMLDSSQLANSSLDSDSFLSQISGVPTKQLSRESATTVRRARRENKPNISQANDADASESQEDDDDPNKLWCICRQPHNNRFMICCDLCEDWYHGTCVSVTKAMGLEMEQKGIDWKCPKCVKMQEEKNQPRITDMLLPMHNSEPSDTILLPKQPNDTKVTTEPQLHMAKRSPTVAMAGTSLSASTPVITKQPKRLLITKSQPKMLHQQQLQFIKLGGNNASATTDVACVVCKKVARPNSVYCSDECIRKYAQSAVQAQTVAKTPEPVQQVVPQTPPINALEAKKNKKKDLFEDVLRQADSVSKVERINVFERRSGRAITGHMAPSAQQLKKWLQDNPSFEVVQPGSVQALEIERRQSKRIPEVSSPEAAAKSPMTTQKPSDTIGKSIQLLSTVPSAPRKEKTMVKPASSQRRSPDKTNTERSMNKSQPEPIRLNVRRTLKEQVLSRIKEAQAADQPTNSCDWLTESEVEHFVKRVESEMYHSFGRDVSAKYKSKYRSLMFNIKDRKNKTLFEKICAKQVEPKQLVRMTPAELASQELAKWREEENRHQLDMIKKSELDLLSCAQNYMVKTHKGEEVIETKVDVTLPEEEQLDQDANNEVIESFNSKKSAQSMESSNYTDASSKEFDLERSTLKEKVSKSRERDRDRDKEKGRDKRHKSHKNHHQSVTKRSRSRSSSRGRSLEKRVHKKHHHDPDPNKEENNKQAIKERADKVQSPLPKKPTEKKPEPLLAFSLIDQILESEKTVEQAANLIQPTKQLKSVNLTATKKIPAKLETKPNLDDYGRYLQGLNSASLWTGNLHMVDVTDFDVVIHSVHGDTSQLAKLLPTSLDVIGRITRDNVWDYLKKIKKSPTKEIVIVNLFPAAASNTINFDSFFEYLDSRQRLGVLGADSEQIRDFYIFPLGTRDKLPSVLLTSDSVPFYEDPQRPNTLLGIIVRCLSKRLVNMSQTLPLPLPSASNKTVKVSNKTRARTTFTPPSSPKRKHSTHSTSSKDDEFDIDAIIKAPIAKLQKLDPVADLDDPNAPYSPGGSSDDNDDLPTSTPGNKIDLERKVDEINKQIAAQRMEIAGLLNVEASGVNKSSSSSSVLANISIPPNLTKILASLNVKSETNVKTTSADDEKYNPEDAINIFSLPKRVLDSGTRTKSRLAQLSEAELLSMVPDNLVDLTPTKSSIHDEPPPPGV